MFVAHNIDTHGWQLLIEYTVLKISQAVGVGFIVMGAIGFVIKLSMFWQLLPSQSEPGLTISLVHIPVNNVLVS
jgi:hypothetical protein